MDHHGRDRRVDLDDVDVDPPLTGVAPLPGSRGSRLDHLGGGVLVECAVAERALGQLRVQGALHSPGVPVEPALEVVEDRALNCLFVGHCNTSAMWAAARAAPSVSTGS